MQLVDTDTVLQRLALTEQADDDKFLAIVSDALDAVTVYIEAQLDTSLDADDHTDTFFLDSALYQAYGGLLRLKLSNGFVQADSLTIIKVDDIFASETPVQLAAQEILLDKKSLEKGFVDIPATYLDKYVTVSYSSGFDSGSDAPPWLLEAALAHCINVISWQQVGDPKPALGKILDEVGKHKGAILNRHLRVSSRSIPAIRST